MKLKIGTVVTCPECKTGQIESTKELLPGGQMKDAEWKSLGFDLDGLRAGCFECGALFVRQHPKTKENQLHIEDHGWISLSKNGSSKPKIILQ